MILYLWKKYWHFIMLWYSLSQFFKKNKSEYYYNIFLERVSYKNKEFYMKFCTSYVQYLDRIDICEGIDVDKTSASKECDICYY